MTRQQYDALEDTSSTGLDALEGAQDINLSFEGQVHPYLHLATDVARSSPGDLTIAASGSDSDRPSCSRTPAVEHDRSEDPEWRALQEELLKSCNLYKPNDINHALRVCNTICRTKPCEQHHRKQMLKKALQKQHHNLVSGWSTAILTGRPHARNSREFPKTSEKRGKDCTPPDKTYGARMQNWSSDGNMYKSCMKYDLRKVYEQLTGSSRPMLNSTTKEMKVKLAAQTLSSSVSKAWFAEAISIQGFANCKVMADFIEAIHCAFDTLNSRNPVAVGSEGPLRLATLQYKKAKMLEVSEMSMLLKLETGQAIIETRSRMSVIALAFTLRSIAGLAEEILWQQLCWYLRSL